MAENKETQAAVKKADQKADNLPAIQQENAAALIIGSNSFFFDMQKFADAQRVATLLAASSLLPAHFQKSIANCVIALNLADRLRVDPFMLMQNLYVVHGRPGIEGKLAIALVEGTGRFSPLKFKMEGEGKTTKGIKRTDCCTAYATELKSGEVIEGPPVTWEMAEAEGWTKNKGTEISKWQTMPDLMFRYRSAMFFARVNCPGALLGLRSSDEIEDIEMAPSGNDRTYVMKDKDDRTAAEEEIKGKANKGVTVYITKSDTTTGGDMTTLESLKQNETAAPGTCPDNPETTYLKSYCDKCKKREGCPTWGEENGQEADTKKGPGF